MGLIIKNGIKYFGDNSVELTQAQYDALSQEEKLNGTTYYITDGENITTASTSIGDIDDVNLSSPADGDALIYDSTTGKWVNKELENKILTVHTKTVSVTFDSSGEGAVSDANINHIIAVEDMMSDSGIYPAYISYRARGGDWRIKTMNRAVLGFSSSGIVSTTRTVKIYYLA